MVGQMAVQFGLELASLVTGKLGCDAVIGFALKSLDFLLALGDESNGHTLHTSSRQARFDFTPQDGREFKSHNAVEHTAGLLGIHQVQVDVAGMLDGIQDGGLGNLVENDTACVVGRQAKHLEQVPGNGFSLAVFITREPHDVGLGGLILELLDLFLFVFRNLINRLKAVFHINTKVFLVQVTDVAKTRHHLVIIAQKLLDGFSLCRRLDYY